MKYIVIRTSELGEIDLEHFVEYYYSDNKNQIALLYYDKPACILELEAAEYNNDEVPFDNILNSDVWR